MGICNQYPKQQYIQPISQIDQHYQHYRKRRYQRRKKFNSVIFEQNTIMDSCPPKIRNEYRKDLLSQLNKIQNIYSSIGDLENVHLQKLYKNLENINSNGKDFDIDQVVSFCNLKTRNYLHTHKIRHRKQKHHNQVSACPYDLDHIIEYDQWKFILTENNKYQIYHPLTETYLRAVGDAAICSTGGEKTEWKVVDFGRRRNGGLVKILFEEENGIVWELCMKDENGLLENHRNVGLCKQNHISHLWQIIQLQQSTNGKYSHDNI